MINYIISETSIAFFDGQETKLLFKDSPVLFSKMKEYLKAGNLGKVKKYSTYEGYIKEEFPELERLNDVYYFKGIELKHLSNTVNAFVKEALPLSPILRFVDKTNELGNSELAEQIQKAVSEGSYPLTWDGDVVGYKRSSWNSGGLRAPEFSTTQEYEAAYAEFKHKMFNAFVPGQYVISDSADRGLLVSNFDWVSQLCPDSGAFYDVKVDVKDILSVNDRNIVTKGYTNLEKLTESYIRDKSSITGVLMQIWTGVNTYGERVVIKQPLNHESIDLFIKDLNNGAKVNSSYLPETVSVTSSC